MAPKRRPNVGPLQVRVANESTEALSDLIGEEITRFEKDDFIANISQCRASEADDDDKDFIFGLTEINMKEMYEKSNWGWNESQKRKELNGKTSRYLIVKDSSGSNVGFVHFRYDMDFDIPVVYCYEIQLVESVQRRGLGGHLMEILHKLAERFKMKKVILTVFKYNTVAINFYQEKLKFRLDATAPKENHVDYTILSKKSVIFW